MPVGKLAGRTAVKLGTSTGLVTVPRAKRSRKGSTPRAVAQAPNRRPRANNSPAEKKPRPAKIKGDTTLNRYYRDLARFPLMTSADEMTLSNLILHLETQCWVDLLSGIPSPSLAIPIMRERMELPIHFHIPSPLPES